MAKKDSRPDKPAPRDFTEVAREIEETSNDGRFSTYEVTKKSDPRDGDLIVQHRGKPDKKTPPGDQ
jgi:hypothetical protein